MMRPPLTSTERTIYQARLDAARIAYDKIMTGASIKMFIDQNGERVEYNPANLTLLAQYIRELEEMLNPCVAEYNRPRAIGFIF